MVTGAHWVKDESIPRVFVNRLLNGQRPDLSLQSLKDFHREAVAPMDPSLAGSCSHKIGALHTMNRSISNSGQDSSDSDDGCPVFVSKNGVE